jgi:hypothetical protein
MNDSSPPEHNPSSGPDRVVVSIPSLIDSLHLNFTQDKHAINSYNTSLDAYTQELMPMIMDDSPEVVELHGIVRVKRPASPVGLSKEDQHDSAIELQRVESSDEVMFESDQRVNEEEPMEFVSEEVIFETEDTSDFLPPIKVTESVIDKAAVIERAFGRLKPKSQDIETRAALDVWISVSYTHRALL